MDETLGNNIANFKISMNEVWSLQKFAAPLIVIPVTIAFIIERGFLEGIIGGLISSFSVSLFLSYFLILLFFFFNRIKLYIHGIEAMDSSGNTKAKMKWNEIERVSSSSLLCFKTITLFDKNNNKLRLFENIKDKDTFSKNVAELAGPDNPFSKFLMNDSYPIA